MGRPTHRITRLFRAWARRRARSHTPARLLPSRQLRLLALCIVAILIGGVLLLSPGGCAVHMPSTDSASSVSQPLTTDHSVRVRLLLNLDQAAVVASQPPTYYTTAD